MSFAEAYTYLLSLSNLPRREYMTDPRHCGVYLKRVQFFLDLIGNPEKKIPHYIHVAGTSGKGSTTALLHSMLQVAGKHVGSTYSPHPTVITERWKMGQRYMTKREFVDIVEFLKTKLDQYIQTSPYDKLSFFELTEVIGFIWFAQKKADWVVLETACGGRYDATNIIPYKDVAVITTIGLDHMELLGDTKEKIAYEKAGIIKKGSRVFTMEKNKKVLAVIEKEAHKQHAVVVLSARGVTSINQTDTGTSFVYNGVAYSLPTIGAHQTYNAALCVDIAEYIGISTRDIQRGISKVTQPLRMEMVHRKPIIVLDGAHNKDKMKTTVQTTKHLIRQKKNLHVIVGFSGDKQVRSMVRQLASLKPKTVTCTRQTTNVFRKVASPDFLMREFKKYLPHAMVECFLDPDAAWKFTQKKLQRNDILLVTGSIFLSGQYRHQVDR